MNGTPCHWCNATGVVTWYSDELGYHTDDCPHCEGSKRLEGYDDGPQSWDSITLTEVAGQ